VSAHLLGLTSSALRQKRLKIRNEEWHGGTQNERGKVSSKWELFIEVVDEALNTSELDYLLVLLGAIGPIGRERERYSPSRL
jgi:hypothetical protein